MTILSKIQEISSRYPDRLAVIHNGNRYSYSELYSLMEAKHESCPIPLLGESWDSDFHLHTTGTTGTSKTIIVPQSAVLANTDNLIYAHGYTPDTVFITTGPLDHLGNWSKIFPVLTLGGTLIILDSMKEIESFYQALDLASELRNNTRTIGSFLVPTAIRLLLQFSDRRLSQYAGRIDFIETGGAPIPHSDMLRLCELLPDARLYNTYASTEAGIVASYNYNDGETIAGCCGRSLKNSEVFITEDGTVACKGKTLMSGYLDDPEQTLKILHDSAVYTSDMGYIDEAGRLFIIGRNDDTINIGGYKVAPAEVEETAMTYPIVQDCICIETKHPVLGSVLKLLVVLEDELTTDLKKQIARYLAQQLDRYKVPLLYEQVQKVERNQNGKLDRKYYKLEIKRTNEPKK